MKKPHKHAELIKAWADGAEIEYYDNRPKEHRWISCGEYTPSWDSRIEFRIKPESKPDIVRFCWVTPGIGEPNPVDFENPPNLKITLDGETKKIKSAEVLQ